MSRDRTTDGSADDGLFATEDAVELYTERVRDPAFFPQEEAAVERYFTETGGTVLDAGCGVGRASHLLHEHERGFDVTGIDVSEPLVEEARSLFPEIDFRVEDVRDTSFESGTFDYVLFSYYGLDYILPKAERLRALREIRRVLKPSGIAVFSSHNSWNPAMWALCLREENRERLLSRAKIERVPLGEVEIYLSNPVHQWVQLRKCGFTPLDVIGKRDGPLRFVERHPHYVAKK